MKSAIHRVKPLPTNARTWLWLNDGWVKLTLREGQFLMWGKFTRGDEGWSSQQYCWNWDGTELSELCHYRGRDCDGLVENIRTVKATHLRVPATHWFDPGFPAPLIPIETPGVYTPHWIEDQVTHRDHAAEAMNY